jgi:hypothetical protein
MKQIAAIMIVFLVSCGSKTAVPKGIIPVNDMTSLLWDVMLADGLAGYRYPLDSARRFDTSVVLYQQITKAHGTTQQNFKKSLRYYESRPDLLQIIMDSLQKRSSIPYQASKRDTLKKS